MNASIITTAQARLLVEFSQFLLFDHFSDARVTNLEAPRQADWVGYSGHGGAVFHTSGRSIRAHVELELWSAQPAEAALGLPQFEGSFVSDSGRVMLASVTGAPSDVTVALPHPGSYVVRAVRLGESLDEDDTQTEAWRLQVWPESS
ncbi:hypothetical protein SAMN04488074_1146 [Lentzea albidocapillata subsp. violacea]|uniref:Uncharacterized protein n=2 Tax=Lentzea albidocapillata TaxID=40571 RepID=A0A1G9NGL4_9PSEU|nr:hypothetical protein SAMN04488074_1146 [Lentzea albidocapillata subsp. violacea]